MIRVHASETMVEGKNGDVCYITVHLSREMILHENIEMPTEWAIRQLKEEIKAFRERENASSSS